jgi:phosphotransacetylase
MKWKKLRSFAEIQRYALKKSPVKMAFLSPEDIDFMKAIKISTERNLVIPLLIGKKQKIEKVAAEINYDLGKLQKIFLDDTQDIANEGLNMLYRGEVNAISKGQMSTNYVYRAVINMEKNFGNLVAVTSFWEISSLRHFVILTDPGVNIKPDRSTKIKIVKKAIDYLKLFGYENPRILAFSARREINKKLLSHTDVQYIKKALSSEGENFSIKSGNFIDLFNTEPENRPNILLMPHLVTGNSIVKLDFYFDIIRHGLIFTSFGPVLIPSRSDTATHIVDEISLAVVISSRFKEGYHENF